MGHLLITDTDIWLVRVTPAPLITISKCPLEEAGIRATIFSTIPRASAGLLTYKERINRSWLE